MSETATTPIGSAGTIVVLATDVFSRPPASRSDIAVAVTIADGKIAYRAAGK